jgi:putative DNA primase/helicase
VTRLRKRDNALLFDEADSFLRNEEMRGILDSGHTKPAAYVIRNVEVDGQFRAKRFSTWAVGCRS